MDVTITAVRSKKELDEFIYFPERHHDGRPNWVPPIWSDEHAFHDPEKNPVIQSCQVERWLAYKEGKIAGRVMGIIHTAYNTKHGERTARFYGLDCIDDPSVSRQLLQTVEEWSRKLGMNQLVGPFGFSDKDPEGLQLEGFEHRPVIATATNAPFLNGRITENGFTKFIDCLVYRLDVPQQTPETYERIAERVMRHHGLRMVRMKSLFHLFNYVVPIFRLLNESYTELYGFTPLSEGEMKKLRNTYLPILRPRFVKLLLDNTGTPAAFVIAVPDFSEGLQQSRGRLLPFGFLRIFSSMRKTRQLNLLLGAVRPDLQGKGVTAALAVDLFRDARTAGFEFMDSHLVLETNVKMRAELERIGAQCYKRYRIYQKSI